ncbi:phytase-like protein with esterase activity [Herbihabitans rhizosphaerae]|uniref:Phytase-like protein with esterase activity n=1 Tax=Herbihabitans rhizosphaerae TaxID=1872711 RepID=A0A4Q7KGV6_9PSEU|nr:esterase-like activity of phytase family protein [Herbihabitans rhizosphaerae]RZS34359.1 phytase-like protein with esterase activity [Herbihabitans rhizosphaerae]
MRLRLLAIPVALASVAALIAVNGASAKPDSTVSLATLPDIPLSEFQGSIADDRNIDLGGIGSDIYPAHRHGEFWTVTDRGPNGQIEVSGKKRRTFPLPMFDPAIVRVRVDGKSVQPVESIPIRTTAGEPVTGLPNQKGHDEAPYTYDASTPLPYNVNGIDPEGLVVARDGSFWLAEEYSPSILHVGRDGRVLARFVPKGLGLTGTGYPVIESLPGILLARKQNRGFEGLAISPDGGTLFAAVQSPLSNPDKDTGEKSRTVRFLAVSTVDGRATAEYVFRMEDVTTFDPSAKGKQDEMKISGLVALDRDRLLVDQRTDKVAKVYVADLAGATDVLGSRHDDPKTSPSLESLPDPAAAGITAARSSLLIDLTAIPGIPGKIEGIALRGTELIVASDNDFGMTDGPDAFDEHGRLHDSGAETVFATIGLRHRP